MGAGSVGIRRRIETRETDCTWPFLINLFISDKRKRSLTSKGITSCRAYTRSSKYRQNTASDLWRHCFRHRCYQLRHTILHGRKLDWSCRS